MIAIHPLVVKIVAIGFLGVASLHLFFTTPQRGCREVGFHSRDVLTSSFLPMRYEMLLKPKTKSRRRSDLLLRKLEDRILFDAAMDASVDPNSGDAGQGFSNLNESAERFEQDVVLHQQESVESDSDSAQNGSNEDLLRLELVIVDTSLDNHQQLVDDLLNNGSGDREFSVALLDSSSDGVDQVSAILSEFHDLNAVHLVSHGDDGAFRLGNTWVTADNLGVYAESLSAWGSALKSNGDFLVYGCDVAESAEGRQLIDQLATLTGADVAASTNNTGSPDQAGDWKLEYQAGTLESSVAFSQLLQQDYDHVLAVGPDVQFYNTERYVPIGQEFSFTIGFQNTGTDVGYGPFVEFIFPGSASGGIEFVSAAVLGQPVDTIEVVFPDDGGGTGTISHPLAVDANGAPLELTGTAGDKLVILELPFGSIAPNQPTVDLVITATASTPAVPASDYYVQARSGFRFGVDPLDNPTNDPSVVSDAGSNASDPTGRSTSWTEQLLLTPVNSTIFVDAANENGTESGTEAQPFGTIQEAIKTAESGDRIFINAGTYQESLVLNKSGIIIDGERAQNGDWLVTLEPPAIDISWTLAPEIGPNVYVTSDIPSDPEILSYNGKTIAKLGSHIMGAGEWGWDLLGSQPDLSVSGVDERPINTGDGDGIQFWDALNSIWGQSGSETYIRFKDGTDPNAAPISVGQKGSIGISIYGKYSDNVIRDIEIRGFEEGIRIRTENANGNRIENNQFSNFQYGIRLYIGASDTIIKNNSFDSGIDGATPGAWAGGESEETGINEFIYRFWKYAYHTSSSNSVAIQLWSAGSDNLIERNSFLGGLSGINVYSSIKLDPTADTVIKDNQFENYSSTGITLRPGQTNTGIFGNSFTNINSTIRAHSLNTDLETSVYVFNNRFHNPENIGTAILTHWFQNQPQPTNAPEFLFYHNSFSGGFRAFSYSSFGDEYGGVPGFHFLNNIFSSKHSIYPHYKLPSNLGTFDSNWIGGVAGSTSADWFGSNNILAFDSYVWDLEDEPASWVLPNGHPAKDAAGKLPAEWITPETGLGKDLGIYQNSGSVGDSIFWDQNANGVQDAAEIGIANIDVQLDVDIDQDGTTDLTLNTKTDVNGQYSFNELPPGDFRVSVAAIAGMAQTFDQDGTLDRQSGGFLGVGQNDQSHDFGFRGTGSIGNQVFFDTLTDGGQFDPTNDRGIQDVDVVLTIDLDGDGTADFVRTATTDVNGGFLFDNLIEGRYKIMVDENDLPDGLANNPSWNLDSTLDLSTEVQLGAGESNNNVDFGFHATPDYQLAISVGQSHVVPGQQTTYRISVTNAGTLRGENVSVTQVIPVDILEQFSTNGKGTVDLQAGTVTWLLDTLGVGETVEVELVANVKSTLDAGVDQLVSSVQVVDDGFHGDDPNPGDNFATSIRGIIAQPDYQLIASNDLVGPAVPGQSFRYLLQVANTGNQAGTNVVVVDTIPVQFLDGFTLSTDDPDNVTFDPSSGELVWSVGSLEGGGDTRALTITVTVKDPVSHWAKSFDNTAMVTDDGINGADPNSQNNIAVNTVGLDATPNYAISTTSSIVDFASPGDSLEYTIKVANLGFQSGSGVIVTDYLPIGIIDPENVLTTDPTNVNYDSATGQLTWNVGNLNGSGSAAWLTIQVAIPFDFDDPFLNTMVNLATVVDDGSQGPDFDLSNNASILSIDVLIYGMDSFNDFGRTRSTTLPIHGFEDQHADFLGAIVTAALDTSTLDNALPQQTIVVNSSLFSRPENAANVSQQQLLSSYQTIDTMHAINVQPIAFE